MLDSISGNGNLSRGRPPLKTLFHKPYTLHLPRHVPQVTTWPMQWHGTGRHRASHPPARPGSHPTHLPSSSSPISGNLVLTTAVRAAYTGEKLGDAS